MQRANQIIYSLSTTANLLRTDMLNDDRRWAPGAGEVVAGWVAAPLEAHKQLKIKQEDLTKRAEKKFSEAFLVNEIKSLHRALTIDVDMEIEEIRRIMDEADATIGAADLSEPAGEVAEGLAEKGLEEAIDIATVKGAGGLAKAVAKAIPKIFSGGISSYNAGKMRRAANEVDGIIAGRLAYIRYEMFGEKDKFANIPPDTKFGIQPKPRMIEDSMANDSITTNKLRDLLDKVEEIIHVMVTQRRNVSDAVFAAQLDAAEKLDQMARATLNHHSWLNRYFCDMTECLDSSSPQVSVIMGALDGYRRTTRKLDEMLDEMLKQADLVLDPPALTAGSGNTLDDALDNLVRKVFATDDVSSGYDVA